MSDSQQYQKLSSDEKGIVSLQFSISKHAEVWQFPLFLSSINPQLIMTPWKIENQQVTFKNKVMP